MPNWLGLCLWVPILVHLFTQWNTASAVLLTQMFAWDFNKICHLPGTNTPILSFMPTICYLVLHDSYCNIALSSGASLVLTIFLVVCLFCHSGSPLPCSKWRAQEKCASSIPSRVEVLKTGWHFPYNPRQIKGKNSALLLHLHTSPPLPSLLFLSLTDLVRFSIVVKGQQLL